MKNFIKQLCIIIVCGTMCGYLSSCKEQDEITFTFSLKCSDDLLDFVYPIATYVDENGTQQNVRLTKSNFSVPDNSGLVGNNNYKLYEWKKVIVLKSESAQRDMRVSYQIREDAPVIEDEKTYVMYHELSSSHSKKSSNNVYVNASTSITIGLDPDMAGVKGKNLNAYLEYLQENPDYQIEKVQ